MSTATIISASEVSRLLNGSDTPGSGVLTLRTPLALRSADETRLFRTDDASPDATIVQLLDALPQDANGVSARAAASARTLGTLREEHAYRDAETLAIFDDIRSAIAAATSTMPILLDISSLDGLDPATLLALRRVFERSRDVALIIRCPCVLKPESTDVEHHQLYGLLDLCVQAELWKNADVVLKTLLSAVMRIHSFALRGLIEYRAGIIASRMGRRMDAAEHYETAIQLLDRADDPDTRVSALNNLGNIRIQEERYEDADLCFAKALSIGEELQSDYHLSVTYGNYAQTMLKRGRPAAAAANLRKSLAFNARSGYYGHTHYIYVGLGDCFAMEGRNTEAIEAFERSLQICELHGNMRDLAYGLMRYGRLLTALARHKEAGARLAESEGLYRRVENSFGIMNALEARAELDIAMGAPENARARLAEAEERARAFRDENVLLRLARLRELAGLL